MQIIKQTNKQSVRKKRERSTGLTVRINKLIVHYKWILLDSIEICLVLIYFTGSQQML